MDGIVITREQQLEEALRELLNCAQAAVDFPNELHIGVLKYACEDASKILAEERTHDNQD